MRVVIDAPNIEIPRGLWCYRVDRRRLVLGGALSNGGNVFAWMKHTLSLPKDIEARLEGSQAGAHGLTFLPFFSGERSPYWRSDLRAAITGLSLATEPFDILRASLEAVALRFREIHGILSSRFQPSQVIASGGALLRSPGWTQMMADALGCPVVACTEPESSSRGAALWTLERIGAIPDLSTLPASLGSVFEPRPEHRDTYDRLSREQSGLYDKLFGTQA